MMIRVVRSLCAFFLWNLMGCSSSLDFHECDVNADCEAGLECSVDGFCVTPASLYEGPALTTDICPFVMGPVEDENTVLIGTILPTSGGAAGLGTPLEQAVTMAIEEFNAYGGVGPEHRNVGAIFCDSRGEASRAAKAKDHLLSLGVKGVVGPADSDVMLSLGELLALDKSTGKSDGMILISPSATNPGITTALDENLLWRVVPSDALQARAIAQLLLNPTEWDLPANSEFVVMYKEGSYGTALKNKLVEELAKGTTEFGTVRTIGYPDPTEYVSNPSLQSPCSTDGSCTDCQTGCCNVCWISKAAAELELIKPDIIVLLGTEEVPGIVGWLSNRIESDEGMPAVEWIVSESGLTNDLFEEVELYANKTFGIQVTRGAENVCGTLCQEKVGLLLERVQGTTPGQPDGETYEAFASAISARHGYETPPLYSAHAYDAAYMLLYGISKAQFDFPGASLTTDAIGAALLLLQGGEKLEALPEEITTGMALLANPTSGGINLQGASGALDMTESGEPQFGPVSVWRPDPSTGTFKQIPIINNNGVVLSPPTADSL